MIVYYRNIDGTVQRADAEIKARHFPSKEQVVVLSDGAIVDRKSWAALGYQVISVTTKELHALKEMGYI